VASALRCGRHIEKDDLVGALGLIQPGALDGISRIAQTLELDSFDDPAVFDVETRDDP
jgi:hypothetical protein